MTNYVISLLEEDRVFWNKHSIKKKRKENFGFFKKLYMIQIYRSSPKLSIHTIYNSIGSFLS